MQKNKLWATIPVLIITVKTLEDHEREFLQPRVASILQKDGLTSIQVLQQLGMAISLFNERN